IPHDNQHRVHQTSNNFGTTTFNYTFMRGGQIKTEIPDPAGEKTYTIVDATEKIIESKDKGGHIFYTYDSRGNTIQANHATSSITYTYNPATGFKTEMSDPSKGLTQYKYDAWGRLIEEID